MERLVGECKGAPKRINIYFDSANGSILGRKHSARGGLGETPGVERPETRKENSPKNLHSPKREST